jgi:hypothetical protein
VVKLKGSVQQGVLKVEEVQNLYHDAEVLALNTPSTGIKALFLKTVSSS